MKRKDILNNEYEVECIGCALGDKRLIPIGGIIQETERFILHQDPDIPIKGFLIIASKQHVKSIAELSDVEAQEFFALCHRARRALLSFEDILGCTLIQEERGHLHLWIFPEYAWMCDLFDDSLSSVRPILAYAREHLRTEENIKEIVAYVERLKHLLNES